MWEPNSYYHANIRKTERSDTREVKVLLQAMLLVWHSSGIVEIFNSSYPRVAKVRLTMQAIAQVWNWRHPQDVDDAIGLAFVLSQRWKISSLSSVVSKRSSTCSVKASYPTEASPTPPSSRCENPASKAILLSSITVLFYDCVFYCSAVSTWKSSYPRDLKTNLCYRCQIQVMLYVGNSSYIIYKSEIEAILRAWNSSSSWKREIPANI